MTARRVVITGMGAVSPLGLDVASFWQSLVAGRSGVGYIRSFDATGFPCRIAAEVNGFSVAPYLPERKWARLLNRGAQFGFAAAVMAAEQASLPSPQVDPRRLAVVLGAGGSRPQPQEVNALALSEERGAPVWARDPVGVLNRACITAPGLIAKHFGARGPNFNSYVACASASQAIGAAYRMIRRGRADTVLTGGHDSTITPWDIMLFCLIGAVCTQDIEPRRASRPFDRRRSGFIMGEGAAILVLEEYAHARARGAPIFAEVFGYGDSMDAYRITDTPPEGEGAAIAMRRALADAGLGPRDIHHINAHGTSTQDNDRSETRAIKAVFGEHAWGIPITANKSMTGHLIAAAGALELLATVLTLRSGVIPPTINLREPDPDCDLDYVPGRARTVEGMQRALCNSFAFGGNNGVVAVGRYEGPGAAPTQECTAEAQS